jgi:hypothetical protein
MPTTARSSTRVKAAMVRREGLRDEGVKGATQRFWILDFSPRLRDTLARGCWIGKGLNEITIKVYIPLIYIVNTSLKCKY